MRMFRGYMLAAVLSMGLAVSACGDRGGIVTPGGSPPGGQHQEPVTSSSPSSIADKTTLDEKGLLGVELAYSGANALATVGVDAGLIKGETAAKIAELDNKAYGFILLARSAYSLGNRTTYGGALDDARSMIGEIISLVKGGRS